MEYHNIELVNSIAIKISEKISYLEAIVDIEKELIGSRKENLIITSWLLYSLFL